ncbi:hypothetical protein BMS3Abin05_00488 [bacterium BMS3Abin05]|nr:hypothetical protein BMS3Abin05_00488 [bacterium BMS3Abin05]GBE26552.1 hypothetical protein BMS3Bbin03_00465 [bacterium BMS3Bbin03]HDK35266.1 MetS family NSS transporter small subunit [Bacteroidota bacterium]HDK36516.1 MetS family NSS transporter small subunit [Bacteroidota bacterium]HDL78610.1 MetS family NSS transporter small subunit [Bacteroidota bacterium]
MTKGAIIFMVVILGIVWGGFIFSLCFALLKERQKRKIA